MSREMTKVEAKHTPGPWTIGRSADNTPAVTVPVPASEGTGFVVAHINRLPRMGSVRGDADANARLMAAAPDLLAALKALSLFDKGKLKAEYHTLIAAADAATAKAEGR